MADPISSFFQSLFSDPKPRAPTRLTSEVRTLGSNQTPSTTPNTQKDDADAIEAVTAPGTAPMSDPGSNNSDREHIRNLRGQFLDERFGSGAKNKGAKVRK